MSLPYAVYMNEFRRQGAFHDTVIKVADRLFPCHRIILASTLKYFRNIFSPVDEIEADQRREIELKNINADDFELVLTHVYGDSIAVDETNVFRLLKLSHHLCLPNLVDLCANYVVKNVSKIPSTTILDIFLFTKKCGMESSVCANASIEFLAKNFTTLRENLVTLPASHLQTILSHSGLDRNNMSAVLNFLVDWTRLQSDEGRKALPDLLDALKLDEKPVLLSDKGWLVKAVEAMNLTNKDPAPSNTRRRSSCHEPQSTLQERFSIALLMLGWIWKNTTSLMLKWIIFVKS